MDLSLECREHDIAYEVGGSQADKDLADARLRMRVYKKFRKAGYAPLVARLMWLGVKAFGWPHFNYKEET